MAPLLLIIKIKQSRGTKGGSAQMGILIYVMWSGKACLRKQTTQEGEEESLMDCWGTVSQASPSKFNSNSQNHRLDIANIRSYF